MSALYHGMNRDELDLAYNNVNAERGYQQIMKRFKDESEALYQNSSVRRNEPYGARTRQRYDWFSCGQPDAPTFVFIHGGYWQNNSKEDVAFVARGPILRGFNVVLAEYTLAPEASMDEIVAEIGMMLNHLQSDINEVGFRGRPVVLCGHSAGGQLAALHRDHPSVTITLSISGLFDLEPISKCWLNEKLQLTDRQIFQHSPLNAFGSATPAIVSVGSAELPELIRQTTTYVDQRRAMGEAYVLLPIRDATHFSILNDLANPDGAHMSAVLGHIRSP
jgi:arylformamidase